MKRLTPNVMSVAAVVLFCCNVGWGQVTVISDDFEDNNITGWTENTSGRWGASGTDKINGNYSLKHTYNNLSSDRDRISLPLNSLSLGDGTVTWSFQAKHGYNPSGNNNWALFLMSDLAASDMYPSGNADGYAVGVNYSGTDDDVKLWKISGGAGYVVIDTDYDWQTEIGTSTAVGFEISRTTSGVWTVKIDSDGGFDNLVNKGTATNTQHTTASYLGVYYEYTASADQKLWIDDIAVTKTVTASVSGTSGFRMMSSPVSGTIFSDLLNELWIQGMTGGDATAGTANVWTLDVSGQSWTALTDLSTTSLTAEEGFLVYVFSDTDNDGDDDLPVTLSVSGTENSSSATLGNIADGDYGLAGNPYASTIDWDLVSKTYLSGTTNVWDNAASGWKDWDGTSGSLTGGLIAPYQGFWVQASGGTGSVTIEPTDKSGSTGTFYRAFDNDGTGSVTFNINTTDGSTDLAYEDQTFLTFKSERSFGMDIGDGKKLLPLQGSSLATGFTIADMTALNINNLPFEYEGIHSVSMDVMILSYLESTFITEAGEITLSWNLDQLPNHINLILIDQLTGIEINLDDNGDYIFNTVPKGSFSAVPDGPIGPYPLVGEPRFNLNVSYDALGQNEDTTLPSDFALNPVYPNPFNPRAFIGFDVPDFSTVRLSVYDINGALVETLLNEIMRPGHHEYTYKPKELASGVYFLKLVSGAKEFTQKVTYVK